MNPNEMRVAVAEVMGTKFGGPYERVTWVTEIESESNPGTFLKAWGYRCTKCGRRQLGETLEDAYCDCGLNPEWLVKGIAFWKWEGWKDCKPVPNYPADLNAMNAVWQLKIFGYSELEGTFLAHLYDIVKRDTGIESNANTRAYIESYVVNATALQRCEAFLNTFKKWKE